MEAASDEKLAEYTATLLGAAPKRGQPVYFMFLGYQGPRGKDATRYKGWIQRIYPNGTILVKWVGQDPFDWSDPPAPKSTGSFTGVAWLYTLFPDPEAM